MPNGRKEIAALLMEFIGTFALIFMGAGAIIQTQGSNLVAIALAHGLAIGLLVAAGGHISGGVYNPAIAIGLMAAGKLPYVRGAMFIVAQLLGATAAAGLLKATLPAAAVDAVKLGTPLPGSGISAGQALVVEIVLTFFLMFVIFGVAVDKRGPASIAGLAIGLTITMDICMGGGISGAAMNPARSFGPMLVQQEWTAAWVYWVGPIIGAILAALIYTFVMLDDNSTDEAVALPQTDDGRPARAAASGGRSAGRRR
ncbi:MAG TPA: MIP/aquaporin family protein [Thermomicrobiales bacterium]|jgi:aquaporin Z